MKYRQLGRTGARLSARLALNFVHLKALPPGRLTFHVKQRNVFEADQQLAGECARLHEQCEQVRADNARLRDEFAALQNSPAIRFKDRLVRIPLLGPLMRRLGAWVRRKR